MPPQRRLIKKKRRVFAVLIVILAIYQRQRVLQLRTREHEERASAYEPPIAYIQRHGWTMDNPGDHFFHNERDVIEYLRYVLHYNSGDGADSDWIIDLTRHKSDSSLQFWTSIVSYGRTGIPRPQILQHVYFCIACQLLAQGESPQLFSRAKLTSM